MGVSARPVFDNTMDGSDENKYSAEPERYYPDTPEQQDGMEESLLDHMQHDARLDSGVPPEHRGAALDSIMMSGLTTPEVAEEIATVSPVPDGTNPSMPVSFYEKGVDDVDSTRGPDALEDARHADADLIIKPPTIVVPDSSVANSFREMIAEFSTETDTKTEDNESIEPYIDTAQTDAPELPDQTDAEDDSAGDVLEATLEPTENLSSETELVEAIDSEEAELVEAISIEEDGFESAESREPDPATPGMEEIPAVEQTPAIANTFKLDDTGESLVEVAPPFPATEPVPPRNEALVEPMPHTAEPEGATAANVSPATRTSPDTPALAEAEALVRQLDEQQRASTPPAPPRLLQDWTFPERSEEELVEDGDAVLVARRRSTGKRSARRRLIRWVVRMAIIAILAMGGYQGYQMYQVVMATDVELYNRANAQLGREAYLEAAALFNSLPERYPGSPLTADAQFMGAYALTLVPDVSSDAPQVYADAILRLQQFMGNNPDHPKRHRAETLLGMMHYRTQNFEQAIAVLRAPQLQKFDREAYLPGLRVLARAYAAVNDVDRAHTTYLRAASLKENSSPDQDYLELAAMYEQRAQHANTADTQRRYLRAAVDQWDVALRLPGLLKIRKKEIRQRRDIVAEELGGGLIMEDGTRAPTAFERSTTMDTPEKENHRQMEQQLLYVD